MTKQIFYLLTLFPIFWEIYNIKNIKRVHAFYERLRSIATEDKTPVQRTYHFFMLGYWVWAVVGLLTFQWPLFLFIIFLGFLPKNYIWFRWVDALITLFVLIFILINAYHTHINIYEQVIKFFK